MKVSELLEYATAHGLVGIVALIELLVLDKQAVKFTDDVAKLDYYFQDRFRVAMNQHVEVYMSKKNKHVMTDEEWNLWMERVDDRYFE
ncbi:hypothetical protein [Bacillus cereus]|uniref:Uncharacterized protein n=1 Tax=Bacillus cereus TaxID=1396 RepID=A0AAW5L5I5_BACCE|nr:hypothetical protein [Bacillus cereus]MCQ6288863.1 hypothetical protein [Bacillus cereus]MCQ6318616.1 hypothetical protein [Bacillus cereus]MCQ6329821.1 hypothetical protein [Bacillus cereus]MCQ6386051.1 hypothetical protein [Bacillus cereus]